MAKSKANMLGPLHTKPSGNTLGPTKVSEGHGDVTVPDPMGFGHGKLRGGPSGESRSQSHEKE